MYTLIFVIVVCIFAAIPKSDNTDDEITNLIGRYWWVIAIILIFIYRR